MRSYKIKRETYAVEDRHWNNISERRETEHTSSYNNPHWWTCQGMMMKVVLFSSSKIGLAKS